MPKRKRVRLRVRCTYVSEGRAILDVLQMTSKYSEFSCKAKHYTSQHDGVFVTDAVMLIAGNTYALHEHRPVFLARNKTYHVVNLGFRAGERFKIPPKAWPAIKAAVIAYNEWVDSENDKLGNTDN